MKSQNPCIHFSASMRPFWKAPCHSIQMSYTAAAHVSRNTFKDGFEPLRSWKTLALTDGVCKPCKGLKLSTVTWPSLAASRRQMRFTPFSRVAMMNFRVDWYCFHRVLCEGKTQKVHADA